VSYSYVDSQKRIYLIGVIFLVRHEEHGELLNVLFVGLNKITKYLTHDNGPLVLSLVFVTNKELTQNPAVNFLTRLSLTDVCWMYSTISLHYLTQNLPFLLLP